MDSLVDNIITVIVNPLILLLFGVAIVVFIIGIIQLIAKADDEEARKKGKKNLVYGIIGLTIMSGAWGIINFLSGTIKEIGGPQSETLLDDYESLRNQDND